MQKARIDGDTHLQNLVRDSFKSPIESLVFMGFEELCFYRETFKPFSAISRFSLYRTLKRAGEVVRIHGLLRISAYFPIMVSQEQSSYCLILKLGVKFYTLFKDETGLITGTMIRENLSDKGARVYRFAGPLNITDAWGFHRTKIREFGFTGKTIESELIFENYLSISNREETLLSEA